MGDPCHLVFPNCAQTARSAKWSCHGWWQGEQSQDSSLMASHVMTFCPKIITCLEGPYARICRNMLKNAFPTEKTTVNIFAY